MNRRDISEAVKNRLSEDHFYGSLSNKQLDWYTARMLNCDEKLLPNLIEWINAAPLSDIWIHDKYCIGAVMKIRSNDDFVSAFIALDDFAKNVDTEFAIWQRWR